MRELERKTRKKTTTKQTQEREGSSEKTGCDPLGIGGRKGEKNTQTVQQNPGTQEKAEKR